MSYEAFSRFYDKLTGNVNYEARAEYYHKLLKDNGVNKGILLDAGCGTGSVSVEMAKKGYEVIGIDTSIGMLMKAREKVSESGEDVLLLNQSMTSLDLYGTVDSAISILDCINHLDSKEDVQKAFNSISLFMIPGGIFAFDVNTVYKHREVLGNNTFVYDTEDVYCVWQNESEENKINIALDFFYTENDEEYYRDFESFSEIAYPLEEIKDMLKKAGFEVLHIYEDMTEKEITSEKYTAENKTEKAVFVARKIK